MSIIIHEASDLGLPPGRWPAAITLPGTEQRYTRLRERRDADGDLQVVIYARWPEGAAGEREELHVLND